MEPNITIVGFGGDIVRKLWKTTLVTGILITLLGLAGIVVPQITSLIVNIFLGWLLIIAGFVSVYVIHLSRWRSAITWLKPVLLLVIGGLLLFDPKAGIAALTLLLTFYLLLDSITNFGFAYDYYPLKGWGWMVFNGIISALLAGLVMFGWPETSALVLGIYVGVSLLFDGLALIFMSLSAKQFIQSV